MSFKYQRMIRIHLNTSDKSFSNKVREDGENLVHMMQMMG